MYSNNFVWVRAGTLMESNVAAATNEGQTGTVILECVFLLVCCFQRLMFCICVFCFGAGSANGGAVDSGLSSP